jgi:hypothetical protein
MVMTVINHRVTLDVVVLYDYWLIDYWLIVHDPRGRIDDHRRWRVPEEHIKPERGVGRSRSTRCEQNS